MVKNVFTSFIIVFVLFVLISSLSHLIKIADAQTPCNTFVSGSTPPQGFGASWNTLSSAKELLLNSECKEDSIKVTAGSSGNNQFIYKTGYYYNNGWQPFTLQGTAVNGTNQWLAGSANFTFSGNNMPVGTLNWVAYVCQWDANKWKCGCSDAVCANTYWQLQSAKMIIPTPSRQSSNCPPTVDPVCGNVAKCVCPPNAGLECMAPCGMMMKKTFNNRCLAEAAGATDIQPGACQSLIPTSASQPGYSCRVQCPGGAPPPPIYYEVGKNCLTISTQAQCESHRLTDPLSKQIIGCKWRPANYSCPLLP